VFRSSGRPTTTIRSTQKATMASMRTTYTVPGY
jgi:hypothetical protein